MTIQSTHEWRPGTCSSANEKRVVGNAPGVHEDRVHGRFLG